MEVDPSNYCAPKFRLLDDSQILRIHHSVLRILDEVGVRISHNQALDLLTSNGTRIKADNGVQIPSFMIEKAIAAAPILIQPNAGKPVTRNGVTYDEQTPSEFAQDARILKENGADRIGGCCGTNPEFIQALSTALFGNSIAD